MTDSYKPGISVVLVAHNEAPRLPKWFARTDWADEIIVIDSGSTDQTADIARMYTANVHTVTIKLNFDLNRNLGFSLASHEWVLSLDADEYPTDKLITEIQSVVHGSECSHVGFELPMRHFVLGREVHGDRHLRLFRNGAASFPGNSVHQSLMVQGTVGVLHGEILHYADDSVFQRVQKSNLYSECIAAHWYEQHRPFRLRDMLLHPVYHFLKSFLRYYRHGTLGFIMSVNAAYSDFLRYAKLWSAYELGHFPSTSEELPGH